jgi:hypothetical protein
MSANPPSITEHNTAVNPDFKARIKVLLIGSAIDIVGEDPINKTTAFIDKRHSLGVQILNNPEAFIERFSFAVVGYNGSIITSESSDSDIQYTLNLIFSDIAGVTFADSQPTV